MVSFLRRLMDERDIRYEQRFQAQQEAVKEALISINVRLAMLNELRSGVATSDQLDALEKVVNALIGRIQDLETTKTARASQTRSIYAFIAAATAIVGIVIILTRGQ